MPKQTRLNFSRATSSTSSKRRKLNADEETTEQSDISPPNSHTADALNKYSGHAESSIKASSKEQLATTHDHQPSTDESPPPRSPKSDGKCEAKPHLTLSYRKANLFASPPTTVLCHATNAQGTWGAGIAAAFKKSYPAAFKMYSNHCSKWDSNSLLGTTLLIPPQSRSPTKSEREAGHWIGCLFTSEKKGQGKGSKESILAATGEAIEDLIRQVRAINEVDNGAAATGHSATTKSTTSSNAKNRIAAVHMCKINSGLFGVPWEATSEVIESTEISEGDVEEIVVVSMD